MPNDVDANADGSEDETLVPVSGSGGKLDAGQDLPAQTKLGKYRIKSLIGKGGMGRVYRAFDTQLQREVALKVLPAEMTRDATGLKRFVREAQSAARLNHPNAVTVFDIGKKKGVHFIAMELVKGRSAEQLVRRQGAIGYEQATPLVADACRALVAAHAAGLIHRDVKPANILVGEDGTTRLADFGLAKPHTAIDPGAPMITRQGAVVGSPKYMSPEQGQCFPLDARTDLYSLGATYYALLTGQAPYDTGTTMQIIYAHVTRPVPDPCELVADLPQGCSDLILKAMAKEPADRYPSAAAMLEDLERILKHADEGSSGHQAQAANDDVRVVSEPVVSGIYQRQPQAEPKTQTQGGARFLILAAIGGGVLIALIVLVIVLILQ